MARYYYDGMSIQNQRSLNMDSLLLKHRVIERKNVYFAVVCDGVGSARDGAFAASTAVRMLSEWFDEVAETNRLSLCLRDYILFINQYIIRTASERKIQTATTLSALLLYEDRYYVVHVGDSRIYAFGENTYRQLTIDHVSERGFLTSCVGKSLELEIFYNEGKAQNTNFLLCSDGLYKKMNEAYFRNEIGKITRRSLKKSISRLSEYVIEQGEKDNISLALIIQES